ncbi:hypothetical protein R6Q57_026148 [Mikania cordata]
MFEFGDDLIIDSCRIPWLIWIQLLAMLLLLILLYCFTVTPADLALNFSTATASGSPSATGVSFANRSLLTSDVVNTRHNSKARENEIKETRTSTSEVVQRAKKPDIRQGAEPSMTNEGSGKMFQHYHHPCHFFGVAKQAFLKCLGIDATLERNHEKDD